MTYWWYSIKLEKNTSISRLTYRTYMNNIASAPYYAMHALQIQNVKHDIVKKFNIDEIKVESESGVKNENKEDLIPKEDFIPLKD